MQCSFLIILGCWNYPCIVRCSTKDHGHILYHFIETSLLSNTRPRSVSDFVAAASCQNGFHLFILVQNLHHKIRRYLNKLCHTHRMGYCVAIKKNEKPSYIHKCKEAREYLRGKKAGCGTFCIYSMLPSVKKGGNNIYLYVPKINLERNENTNTVGVCWKGAQWPWVGGLEWERESDHT